MRKKRQPGRSWWGDVLAMAFLGAVVWVIFVPPAELFSQSDAAPLGLYAPGESYDSAYPYDEPSPIAPLTEVPVDSGPLKVVVTDYGSEDSHPGLPARCSFGYKYVEQETSRGCVSRGRFAVGPQGSVWQVACKLGNCWKFGMLCVYRSRGPRLGYNVLLPAEINYRADVRPTDKVGAC